MVAEAIFQKLLIFIVLTFLSFSHFTTFACPPESYPVPSIFGSRYNCVFLSNEAATFVDAEEACMNKNAHLISVPNGFVNMFLAGE